MLKELKQASASVESKEALSISDGHHREEEQPRRKLVIEEEEDDDSEEEEEPVAVQPGRFEPQSTKPSPSPSQPSVRTPLGKARVEEMEVDLTSLAPSVASLPPSTPAQPSPSGPSVSPASASASAVPPSSSSAPSTSPPSAFAVPPSSSAALRPPRSAMEFDSQYRGVRADPARLSALLRAIPSADFPTLLRTSLDTSLLTHFLQAIDHLLAAADATAVWHVLSSLPTVPRFALTVGFLASKDKQTLSRAFQLVLSQPPQGVTEGSVRAVASKYRIEL
jgi:hypothetical protein